MPVTRAMAAGKTATALKPNTSAPRKRPRTGKAAPRAPKRSGKISLHRILDMPPEVFNMVAAYLEPADLLSLARSNKFFRAMFMSRSSERLWETALANVEGLPPCPPELSEPQYISLIWSKTCSECGVKTQRRMDPFLCVRLCNTCRDVKLVEVDILGPFMQLLTVGQDSRYGHVYALRRELDEVRTKAAKQRGNRLAEWAKVQIERTNARNERGIELEDWLAEQDRKREKELEDIRAERENQIKARLLEEGWTTRDMDTAPQNWGRWCHFVLQAKPLTDRIWNNMYPQLVPILESNRTYHDEMDKKTRHKERIQRLESLASEIRSALPPLVHVVHQGNEDRIPPQHRELKVDMPFPTMAELLTWPTIREMIGRDTSPDELQTAFVNAREEFDRAVVEWKEKIEQELIEIWNAGRTEQVRVEGTETEVQVKAQDQSGHRRSTTRGKGKAKDVDKSTPRRSTRHTKGQTANQPSTSKVNPMPQQDDPVPEPIDLSLPEFTITFTKPDGTTTTDISDLPANLRILLRADTIFKGEGAIDYTYPRIVPRIYPMRMFYGSLEQFAHGDRWDGSKIKRGDEASSVAKSILHMIQRPQATSAEMEALGSGWKCGRCDRTLTDKWDQLVLHYSREQSQYRQAQEKMQAEPKAGYVYNSTHDFGPGQATPFAEFLSPQAAADYVFENTLDHMPMTECMKCERMGIVDTRYFHSYTPEVRSPIVQHLQDVHNIANPVFGMDFRPSKYDIHMYDPHEEEMYSDEYGSDDFDSDDDGSLDFLGTGLGLPGLPIPLSPAAAD